MLVYISDHLNKRLSKDLQDYQKTIESLQERITQLNNPLDFPYNTGFWSVGNSLYLYRSSHRTYRLIAGFRYICQKYVVIFYDVLNHLDETYEDFYRNLDAGVVRIKSLVKETSVEHWVRKQQQAAPPLESLPPSFHSWLHIDLSLNHQFVQDQNMIYESHTWAKSVLTLIEQDHEEQLRNMVSQGHADQLHEMVINAWSSLPSEKTTTLPPKTVQIRAQTGCWIAYQILHNPQQNRCALCLISAGEGEPPVSEDMILSNFSSEMLDDLDQIAKHCRRVYSSKQLEKKEIWQELEKMKEHSLDPCLPLSREEMNVLQGLESEKIFPLFVDGPAGSGKSTLLSYYIAALIDYSRSIRTSSDQERSGWPLFVTYNQRLQEETRKRVIYHLRYHFDWQIEDAQQITSSGPFFTLRQLFRTLLSDEQEKQFRIENHVGFPQFRERFWETHCRASHHGSPEMAWFVIRSFIKGYATAEQGIVQDFTSETFLCLPESRQDGLLIEDFKRVEYHVWPMYKKWLDNHRLWDDQDLCLRILSSRRISDYLSPKNPWMAVVCDEAQDLTCNDLRLLFRLLGFTRYNISSYSNPLIPFIFAADPMQTVNPSGFRWESFTSLFYEETGLLFGGTENAIAKKQHSLQWNYRSHRDIVHTSTAIQKWRNKHLDGWRHTETIPWNQEVGLIRRYILPDNITEHIESLQAIFQKSVVIVPCQEDQAEQYVQQDRFLNTIRKNSAMEVFSPLTIKGLEFSQVILYGFGQKLTTLWKYNEHTKQGSYLRSKKELDFMLNALYVAATRARTAVYFVDSYEGDKVFWGPGFLGSSDITPRLPATITTKEWVDLKNKTPDDDLLKAAKELLRQGIDEKNTHHCKKAAALFAQLQKFNEFRLARAWGQFFETPDESTIVWEFYEQNKLDMFEEYCWKQSLWKGFYLLEQEGLSATTPYGSLGRYIGLFAETETIAFEKVDIIATDIIDCMHQDLDHKDRLLVKFYRYFLEKISDTIQHGTQQSSVWFSQEKWRDILKACQYLRKYASEEAHVTCMWISAVLGDHERATTYYHSIIKTTMPADSQQKLALQLMRWLHHLDWIPVNLFLEKTYSSAITTDFLTDIFANENSKTILDNLLHEDIIPHAIQHLPSLRMTSPIAVALSGMVLERSMANHLQHIDSFLTTFADFTTTDTQIALS